MQHVVNVGRSNDLFIMKRHIIWAFVCCCAEVPILRRKGPTNDVAVAAFPQSPHVDYVGNSQTKTAHSCKKHVPQDCTTGSRRNQFSALWRCSQMLHLARHPKHHAHVCAIPAADKHTRENQGVGKVEGFGVPTQTFRLSGSYSYKAAQLHPLKTCTLILATGPLLGVAAICDPPFSVHALFRPSAHPEALASILSLGFLLGGFRL